MSTGAVTERISKLEKSGVITGYRATVAAELVGYDLQVLIGIQMEHGVSHLDTINRLLEIPQLTSVQMVTGRWDLVVNISAKGQHHLREILLDQVWTVPGFRHSETMMILSEDSRPLGF